MTQSTCGLVLTVAYLLVTSADDEHVTENVVILDLMRSLGVPKVELYVTNHPLE